MFEYGFQTCQVLNAGIEFLQKLPKLDSPQLDDEKKETVKNFKELLSKLEPLNELRSINAAMPHKNVNDYVYKKPKKMKRSNSLPGSTDTISLLYNIKNEFNNQISYVSTKTPKVLYSVNKDANTDVIEKNTFELSENMLDNRVKAKKALANVKLYVDKKCVGKYLGCIYENCILMSSKMENFPSDYIINLENAELQANKNLRDQLNINLEFNFKLYTIRFEAAYICTDWKDIIYEINKGGHHYEKTIQLKLSTSTTNNTPQKPNEQKYTSIYDEDEVRTRIESFAKMKNIEEGPISEPEYSTIENKKIRIVSSNSGNNNENPYSTIRKFEKVSNPIYSTTEVNIQPSELSELHAFVAFSAPRKISETLKACLDPEHSGNINFNVVTEKLNPVQSLILRFNSLI